MIETLDRLGSRTATMTRALEEFGERDGQVIVETGCARVPDNWTGDGLSTAVFGEYLSAHSGHLWTVDHNPNALEVAQRITTEYADAITYTLGDSVEFLADWDGTPIDLLYLDSLDYPYGAMLDAHGGAVDIDAAIAELVALPEAEIVAEFADSINPPQEHCLAELTTAWRYLHPRSLILIDDAGLPGGGKARLARQFLDEHGAVLLADAYQALWSVA